MRVLSILFWCTLLPSAVFGYATRIATQDPYATARGNAFTATADNPSAIYYNPAGLMQLEGVNVSLGGYGIWINDDYTPLHHNSPGHASSAHEPLQVVPEFFATWHPRDKPFAVGLGIYAPFGLKTNWPDDASFRTAGYYGSLTFVDFNPTFAVQVTRTLSVGLGISVDYLDASLREGLSSMQGDSFTFKGNGLTIGGNVGILWKPTGRQSIGISYHSPVTGHLSGHTHTGLNGTERSQSEAGNAAVAEGRVKIDQTIQIINALPISAAQKQQYIAQLNAGYAAELKAINYPPGGFPTTFPTLAAHGNLQFPQYVTVGYSFRPTPEWNIEADIDWTDWDSLNTFKLKRADGSQINVPFNWTHSFLYELGVTHVMGPWRVSAGYIYSENSVPSSSFSPIIPDSSRHILSVGVGRAFGSCSVDLAYQLGLGGTRTIVNDSVADGHYSFTSHAVSLSLGYHF